ncbi:hypothetical protein Thimo_2906 [Thioflavicoccus mobilis 8321]|uniref:Uncharacterized protein n=1 Tax=Thioflavicoccus mobilis 8321 TaxID=765912 RepID=L0H0L7_9GAMM|nr:hypothetical protein [Thioflavicoccus mobilis]AGA91602.1 hypothetical protein Thimo_2906 [Thioflavicoccus mobilis 8321]
MRHLIARARTSLPFTDPEIQTCTGRCDVCATKLLEALAIELDDWERRLDEGAKPTLRDLSDLARACRQVWETLAAEGLVEPNAPSRQST